MTTTAQVTEKIIEDIQETYYDDNCAWGGCERDPHKLIELNVTSNSKAMQYIPKELKLNSKLVKGVLSNSILTWRVMKYLRYDQRKMFF